MVQSLRLRRATWQWMARLERQARDTDPPVRRRLPLKVHAGRSPHTTASGLACAPWTACRIVA